MGGIVSSLVSGLNREPIGLHRTDGCGGSSGFLENVGALKISPAATERLQRRTSKQHQSPAHIAAVPLFMSATPLAVYTLVGLSSPALAATALCFVVSLIVQGRRPKLESTPPEPCKGGLDCSLRLFGER